MNRSQISACWPLRSSGRLEITLDRKPDKSTISEETTEDVVKAGISELRISTSSSWGVFFEMGIIALAIPSFIIRCRDRKWSGEGR